MAKFSDRINKKKDKRNNTTSIPSPSASAANSLGLQDAYSIGRLNGVRGQQKITPQTVGAIIGAAKPTGTATVPNAALSSAISGAARPKSTATIPNAALISAIAGAVPFLKKEIPANTAQSGGSGGGGGGGYQTGSYVPSVDIGERPTFNSQYMAKLNELVKQLTGMNYGDWTGGEQYRSLHDRYSNNGRVGMQDVLGQVSARTGGLASSYATSAAQQQYNSYMNQLEEVARQMYAQERSDILSDANMYRNLVNDEYGRFRDEVADYDARYAAAQAAALEAAKLAARGSGGGGTKDTAYQVQAPKVDPSKYYTKPSANRVNVPNYGKVSYEDAETLEKKGFIKLLGVNKKGEPVFAPTTKKNYRDPVRLTR